MQANPAQAAVPDEPHDASVPEPHHAVNYLLIFFALVALTIVTVLVAFKRFDDELVNVTLALLIACIKAIFVARFFMHLKFEGKLIYVILLVPLCLTVILVCALIPDVVMGATTDAHSGNGSLHWINNPYVMFDKAHPAH